MSLLRTLLAPTKLKVNFIGLQSSGPVGASLNSSASTLCLAHLALATLASLFLEKARQIPASDLTLVPPDTYLHNVLPVSFVFASLSLGGAFRDHPTYNGNSCLQIQPPPSCSVSIVLVELYSLFCL